uniref:DUF2283 domain-containing protein n=1 Tax=Candidatus Kentrum sp. LPFa TaxID=2126335 RepID=A0A450Y0B4_9GAMM|nr:MAG: Protein of unknown function (DUF2283) [Candidatus Kentron sp. LPFa]VFK34970.1 MAG: Protein of unknown function (DUF2283) [Candidatus Kentron sp. LPFa]
MSNPQLSYFQDEDILHLSLSDESEAGSVEISPDITAELNENGDLIGIEILAASAFFRDSILESAQAKLLGLRSFPNPCLSQKQQPSIKNSMDYVLTEHARKRCIRRKIKQEWIATAFPEKSFRVLRVIYNETIDPVSVVTAYFDDEVTDL